MQEDSKLQDNKSEAAAASLQLIPFPYQSLPAEEDTKEDTKEDLEEESQGEEAEEESRAARRLIVKLKPCRRLDDISSNTFLSREADHSGSPLSSTTS